MIAPENENPTPGSAGRIIAAHIKMLAVGMIITGACGGLMLTDSAFNSADREITAQAEIAPAYAASDTVSDDIATDDETTADEDTTSVQSAVTEEETYTEQPDGSSDEVKPEFISFKKAYIGEYDISIPGTKTKSVQNESGGILDPNDFTVPFPAQNTIIYEPARNNPLNLNAVRSVAGEYFTVNDENSGSTLTLNAHELLCLIVNNEIGDSWADDAIKAQIVAAYSYLRFNVEHGFTPTVGLRYGYSSRLDGLVSSVEGQVMTYNGSIIDAVYSASTAGYSTTSEDIWGVAYPYLRCVESIYDDQDPNWGKKQTFSEAEIRSRLESKFGITLSDDVTKWFTIERAYSVRYIDKLIIDGRSECSMTGVDLCYLVDLDSNAIEIKYKDGEFTFISYGWGHGVGMSQWGAHYYAENGWSYDQILTHYYVDARLELSSPAPNSAPPADDDSSQSDETAEEIIPENDEPDYYETPAAAAEAYGEYSSAGDTQTEYVPPAAELDSLYDESSELWDH